MLPTHQRIPDPTTGYALNPERGWVSVYLPSATTNLFRNPSFERDVLNWTATSDGSAGTAFDRTAAAQFRGAYAGILTIRTGGTFVQIVGATNATAGQVYALQCHFKRPGAANIVPAQVRAVVNGAPVPWQSLVYVADGWWRGELVYTAVGSNPAGVRVTGSPGQIVYVDGLQWEQQSECSTYVDGDEPGLLPGETPPAYVWNGTPHASTSSRSGTTRAGGLRRRLDAYGLTVIGLVGLGMPPQENQTIPYAGLDGSFYQSARRPERGLTIAGAFQAQTPQELDRMRRDVRAALTFDRTGVAIPVVLEIQAFRGRTAIGEAVTCVCSYVGGLEANQGSLYGEKVGIQLVEHVPGLTALASRGGVLANRVTTAFGTGNFVMLYTPATGAWSNLGDSVNGAVSRNALVWGPDGKLYAGGAFLAPGTRIARYNLDTAAWETLGAGLAQTVNALAFAADGRLFAGLNAAVTIGAATGSVVVWDGAAWAVFGATGTNLDQVFALAVSPTGGAVYAGGIAGGNATLRSSTGGAWAAITAATPGTVFDLALSADGVRLYVGGAFTALAGVAGLDNVALRVLSPVATWQSLAGGSNAEVYQLALDSRERLYASGEFTTAGGQAADGYAVWNGSAWQALTNIPGTSAGVNNSGGMAYDTTRDQVILTNVRGVIARNDGTLIRWRDGAIGALGQYTTLAFNLISAIAPAPSRIAVARTSGSSIAAAGLTSVVNPGSLPGNLALRLTNGSASNRVALVEVSIPTIGRGALWALDTAPGEEVTITLTPGATGVRSQQRGVLSEAFAPGSFPQRLQVPPGTSSMLLDVPLTDLAGVYWYHPRYGALGDAVR